MQNFEEFLYSKFLTSTGVSTDTRTLKKGEMFFALSGQNHNGNRFAEEAFRRGACWAVVDDDNLLMDNRCILSENALSALQNLSLFHRKRLNIPVLGLTGSNGKTTTKELIARVLSKKYITHATEGNLNNHIGVPLTLLGIRPQTEVAVIEMGASAVGEVAFLAGLVLPTHGLITNIGHAHTETFGGIEGVLRGKSELFDFLQKHGCSAFINLSDHRLRPMQRRFEKVFTYPHKSMRFEGAEPFVSYGYKGRTYTTRLVGAYNFSNIAAAVCVGTCFGVEEEDILEAINTYEPDNLRSQVIVKDNIRLIMDAYNANPDSMNAALHTFNAMKGKKAVILGDMLELDEPEKEHRKLGKLLSGMSFENVFLVGEEMKAAAQALRNVIHVNNIEDVFDWLRQFDFSGYAILLKGSRKMKLEQLKEYIH